MMRAIHGAPAEALRQALKALAGLSFWISWTSDPDLGPEPLVSARCMRDAANALRKAARLLDDAANRADPPLDTARRAAAPVSGEAPDDPSGDGAGRPTAGTRATQEQQPEAEPSAARAGACRPERAASAPPIRPSMEIRMNHIAPPPEPAIRDIPLCQLALAPENVRKTSPDEAADAQLIASIKSHGLLENLVARADDPAEDGAERYAVVAGGRRLAALKALAEDGTLDALHPVPCKITANGNAGELSLAEIAARMFGLELLPASAPDHDAITGDGRKVQIKFTQGTRGVALRAEPDHLLVLCLDRDRSLEVVYNGKGKSPWSQSGKMQTNGQRQISLARLRTIDRAVPERDRLPPCRMVDLALPDLQ